MKSRYSFPWQYLGADLQPLWVETARCYLGCLFWWRGLFSIHHFIPPREAEACPGTPGAPGRAAGLGGWIPGFAQERSVNGIQGRARGSAGTSGSVGQGLRPWNHYTHGAGSRASTAGLLLQHINIRFIFSHQSWECKETLDTPGSAGASVHLLARNAKPAHFPHFPKEKNKYITEQNAFQHAAKRAGDGSAVLGCSIVKYYHYCSIIVIALQNNFFSFLFLEVKKHLKVWIHVCGLLYF